MNRPELKFYIVFIICLSLVNTILRLFSLWFPIVLNVFLIGIVTGVLIANKSKKKEVNKDD